MAPVSSTLDLVNYTFVEMAIHKAVLFLLASLIASPVVAAIPPETLAVFQAIQKPAPPPG